MSYAARNVVWPNVQALTNLVAVLYDARTGNLVNATTGACSSSVAWGDAAFVYAAALAVGKWSPHAQSNQPVFSLPALAKGILYGLLFFDSASPAKTDTIASSMFYDAKDGMVFTDMVPTREGEVKNRTFIE